MNDGPAILVDESCLKLTRLQSSRALFLPTDSNDGTRKRLFANIACLGCKLNFKFFLFHSLSMQRSRFPSPSVGQLRVGSAIWSTTMPTTGHDCLLRIDPVTMNVVSTSHCFGRVTAFCCLRVDQLQQRFFFSNTQFSFGCSMQSGIITMLQMGGSNVGKIVETYSHLEIFEIQMNCGITLVQPRAITRQRDRM